MDGLQRTTTSEALTPASAANAAAIPFLAAGVMDSTVPAAVKLIVTPGDAGGDAGNGDGGGGGGARGSGAGGGAAGNGFPGDESKAPDAAIPARNAATIVTAQATTPPRMRSRRFEPDGLTITAPLSSALFFVPALPTGFSVAPSDHACLIILPALLGGGGRCCRRGRGRPCTRGFCGLSSDIIAKRCTWGIDESFSY